MTLGLTDPSPWADNMGEPRAWHNLKYLWHTLGIRKNPKGNQNTSASVILEDTRLMKNPLYKEMFAHHVLDCSSRVLQGKDFEVKEERPTSYYYKSPNTSQIKVRIIYPL